MLGRKQIVVEDDNFLYYGNGKRTEKRRLIGNYEIIKILDKEGYNCRKAKPPAGVKYIYKRQKDGEIQYCYTNTLNTDFLNLVLRDKIEPEKPTLLKLTDRLGILFFQKNYIPVIGENWEEVKKQAELILQGIPYREVDYKLLKKYIKKSEIWKYITYTLVAVGLAFLGYYIYENYIYSPPPPPPPPPTQVINPVNTKPKKKKKEENIPYANTYRLLQIIHSIKLPAYIFIKDINFSTETLYIASFYPLPTYIFRGTFYVKTITLEPDELKNIPIPKATIEHNRPKCLAFLNKFPILENTGYYMVYEISNPSIDIDKLDNILRFLQYCPVSLKGVISYQNLLRRSIDLKVYYYFR